MSFYLSQHHSEKSLFDQDWIRKAGRIRCSAPLPEGLPDPVLTRMLARTPHQVPSGEDEGREAESGLHALLIRTGGISVSTKEDNRGEESKIPSPQGRMRDASEDLETMVQMREETFVRGPYPRGHPYRTVPARGSALHRAVSEHEYFW